MDKLKFIRDEVQMEINKFTDHLINEAIYQRLEKLENKTTNNPLTLLKSKTILLADNAFAHLSRSYAEKRSSMTNSVMIELKSKMGEKFSFFVSNQSGSKKENLDKSFEIEKEKKTGPLENKTDKESIDYPTESKEKIEVDKFSVETHLDDSESSDELSSDENTSLEELKEYVSETKDEKELAEFIDSAIDHLSNRLNDSNDKLNSNSDLAALMIKNKSYANRMTDVINEAKTSQIADKGVNDKFYNLIKNELETNINSGLYQGNSESIEKLIVLLQLINEEKLHFSNTTTFHNFIQMNTLNIEAILRYGLEIEPRSNYFVNKDGPIFNTKGFNLLVENLKKKEKYQDLSCPVLQGANALLSEIHKVHDTENDLEFRTFAVWNREDALEHMFPVFVEKKENKTTLFITNSTGNTSYIQEILAALNNDSLTNNKDKIEIYLYDPKRQNDNSNCTLFTLEDIKNMHVLRQQGFSISEFEKQIKSEQSNNETNIYFFDSLPARMMAPTQSLTYIKDFIDKQTDSEGVERLSSKVEKHTRISSENSDRKINNLIDDLLWKSLGMLYVELLLEGLKNKANTQNQS